MEPIRQIVNPQTHAQFSAHLPEASLTKLKEKIIVLKYAVSPVIT